MTPSLPIFALNTVLYPGGLLPLKVFEQRYLEMTKACVRDGSAFGVCRIKQGQEVGLPAVPEEIGCSALILEWDMPHLGVFHLRARGEKPFRILQYKTQRDGLIRAEIEYLEDARGAVAAEPFALCRRVLEQIIGKLGTDFFLAPLAYEDPRWTSYRLAEVLPLETEHKQALLALREDGARLARLHAYLERAR